MAENDYKTLKARIEELIENIDKIDQETVSFSGAKSELVKIAGDLHTISSDLSISIKTAATILEQIETVAVSDTLEKMKNSAARFDETCNQLLTGFDQSMKESAEKHAETSADLIRLVKAENEEHVHMFQQKVDALAADFKKKMYIIGGIAIVCSIAALFCAFA